jgi:hypothetical protein
MKNFPVISKPYRNEIVNKEKRLTDFNGTSKYLIDTDDLLEAKTPN